MNHGIKMGEQEPKSLSVVDSLSLSLNFGEEDMAHNPNEISQPRQDSAEESLRQANAAYEELTGYVDT